MALKEENKCFLTEKQNKSMWEGWLVLVPWTDTGTRNKCIQLSIQHFCLNQFYMYIILVNSCIQHNLFSLGVQTKDFKICPLSVS